jgi:ketohexokinase
MRVLGVGIATLDLVNEVDRYPAEDAEIRARAQRVGRGGNCTNTLAVLAQLGHACSWAGTLGDDAAADRVMRDLAGQAVDARWVERRAGEHTPTSCITLSLSTGSRTIVHFRELAEFRAEAFARIPLEDFDWVHFEGRAVPELARMLDRLDAAGGPPCSLEVEKPREGIEDLFGRVDLLLFGRAYAESHGHVEAASLLRDAAPATVDAVCAWGDRGAWGRAADGEIYHAPAWRPERVVDTLGAGDVFNAAAIDARLRGAAMPAVLEAACRLAGVKCGRRGLDQLRDVTTP